MHNKVVSRSKFLSFLRKPYLILVSPNPFCFPAKPQQFQAWKACKEILLTSGGQRPWRGDGVQEVCAPNNETDTVRRVYAGSEKGFPDAQSVWGHFLFRAPSWSWRKGRWSWGWIIHPAEQTPRWEISCIWKENKTHGDRLCQQGTKHHLTGTSMRSLIPYTQENKRCSNLAALRATGCLQTVVLCGNKCPEQVWMALLQWPASTRLCQKKRRPVVSATIPSPSWWKRGEPPIPSSTTREGRQRSRQLSPFPQRFMSCINILLSPHKRNSTANYSSGGRSFKLQNTIICESCPYSACKEDFSHRYAQSAVCT